MLTLKSLSDFLLTTDNISLCIRSELFSDTPVYFAVNPNIMFDACVKQKDIVIGAPYDSKKDFVPTIRLAPKYGIDINYLKQLASWKDHSFLKKFPYLKEEHISSPYFEVNDNLRDRGNVILLRTQLNYLLEPVNYHTYYDSFHKSFLNYPLLVYILKPYLFPCELSYDEVNETYCIDLIDETNL